MILGITDHPMPRAFLIRSRSAFPTQNSKKENLPDVQDENTDRNAQPTGISEHFKQGNLYLLLIIFVNFRKEKKREVHISLRCLVQTQIYCNLAFSFKFDETIRHDFHVEILLKLLLIKFTQTKHNFS